jgi:predicted tellurium resistance membrane protein TerC
MPAGTVSRLLIDGFSIILIDLLLAGDNALLIAMAVRALPQRHRKLAIISGAGAASRCGSLTTAALILGIEFTAIGGAFIIWIAIKVLADAVGAAASHPAVDSSRQFGSRRYHNVHRHRPGRRRRGQRQRPPDHLWSVREHSIRGVFQ